MAVLFPFQGLRYNPNKVKDIRKVICPPYDVIDAQAQDRYYKSHEYNLIRVELGKDTPDDTPSKNRYTRGAAFLKDWIKKEVLIRDAEPSFYLYKMDYSLPKIGEKTLTGFFSLAQLEEIGRGNILPHEFTFPSAKQDRLRLMRACHANISPIFMLYSDPAGDIITHLERCVDEAHPLANFVDEDDVHHRFWKVSSPPSWSAVIEALKDKPFFIADGHHRYETALNFRNEMRAHEKSGGPSAGTPKPYDSVSVFCSNMDDAGISLLPIHRVILNPLPFDLKTLRQRLARSFEVTHLSFNNATENKTRKRLLDEMKTLAPSATVFGMYAKTEQAYHLLKLKKEAAPSPSGTAKPIDSLDVSRFQKVILGDTLGMMGSAAKKEGRIQFVKDDETAVKQVKSGEAGLAFFLNATLISQVREVVLAGDRMPQKSTYFHPKPVTGLVINKF